MLRSIIFSIFFLFGISSFAQDIPQEKKICNVQISSIPSNVLVRVMDSKEVLGLTPIVVEKPCDELRYFLLERVGYRSISLAAEKETKMLSVEMQEIPKKINTSSSAKSANSYRSNSKPNCKKGCTCGNACIPCNRRCSK